MITASHNPYTDNGIKFIDSNGEVIQSELEPIAEKFLESNLE